jgi:predicted phosphate transport protein (TIGR00153 family)
MARNTIIGVFAKSPIKPLEKHIRLVAKCSKQLIPFFNASTSSDWEEATNIRKQISAYEKDADELKRKLRLELPSGLFMPVERTDILELLSEQD